MDINEIFAGQDVGTIITELKKRSNNVPEWGELLKDYEPKFHKIVDDKQGRKDKIHTDGTVDKAARISLGLEKLLVKRMTEFTFSIPVKRIYSTTSETQEAIAKAIEAIYKNAHINSENIKRGIAYNASCEIFTLWYTVQRQHTLYGFPCSFKLKCRTFSPMNGSKLYPLFDETGDLIAVSYEYEQTVGKDLTIFFETFTANAHYKWQTVGKDWEQVEEPERITILKIPGAYLYRPMPVFDGLQPLREDLEYTLSRNSDVVAYNSAPILKIVGNLIGDESKGETRRVYKVTEGGDVDYVSWAQSVGAQESHSNALLKYFWMQSQMPDISFDNMKSLGNIGYDARKMLLIDSHLKIGEESGPWLEFLQRECNVIKAFLKKLNVRWADEVDNVGVEHVITPFIMEDEAAQIDMHMKANGGKPVESQRESIQRIGKSADVDQTMKEIQADEALKAAEEAKKELEKQNQSKK